jgi:hypothetical protein
LLYWQAKEEKPTFRVLLACLASFPTGTDHLETGRNLAGERTTSIPPAGHPSSLWLLDPVSDPTNWPAFGRLISQKTIDHGRRPQSIIGVIEVEQVGAIDGPGKRAENLPGRQKREMFQPPLGVLSTPIFHQHRRSRNIPRERLADPQSCGAHKLLRQIGRLRAYFVANRQTNAITARIAVAGSGTGLGKFAEAIVLELPCIDEINMCA